jgi:coenzyme F420-reducing hydrogenase gamma subunit
MAGDGRRRAPRRPRVGVVKFASCDGCQLTMLDLEDELLAIAERFDIVEFAEATSNRSQGPFDVLLVEGSISTPEQAHEIVRLRREATTLVTIGACATSGGIQALRNLADHDAFRAAVYPRPELIESLATSTPVSEHVAVDGELYGCPISPRQLLELLTSLSVGRRPQLPDEAVCVECKRLGNPCILVAQGVPCLGPVTRTGCGALCPTFARGCYGCFGPRESANTTSLAAWLASLGQSDAEIAREFAKFNVGAPAFRRVVEANR